MNPTPTKRRRSSSPSTPSGRPREPGPGSGPPIDSRGRPPSASPANPTLPPPIPSFPHFGPPGGPGPSTLHFRSTAGREWDREREFRDRERERDRERDRDVMEQRVLARRSMDARSPESVVTSPRMEGIEEVGEVVFSRDVSSRAPRSMMACTRCRKQK
jgi:hypothetical protein